MCFAHHPLSESHSSSCLSLCPVVARYSEPEAFIANKTLRDVSLFQVIQTMRSGLEHTIREWQHPSVQCEDWVPLQTPPQRGTIPFTISKMAAMSPIGDLERLEVIFVPHPMSHSSSSSSPSSILAPSPISSAMKEMTAKIEKVCQL